MKKIIITLALAAASIICANAQVRIEVAGNTSTIGISSGNSTYTLDAGLGAAVRGFYCLESASNWGLEFGVSYVGRNSKSKKASELFDSATATMKVSSLEIPVHGYYNIKIGDAFAITPMIGLYAGYRLNGQVNGGVGGITVGTDPFEGENGLRRFDFGSDEELLFTIANRMTIGVGLQFGLLNMCKSDDVMMTPVTVYAALGWKF